MDQFPNPPTRRRRWRRLGAFALITSALALGWFLFFPVPLGAVARFGLKRALPIDGPLQLSVEAVTFRWRWGQPALDLEIKNAVASARGRPLSTIRELVVELPKSGLWSHHFAPSRITVTEPKLIFDQTPAGALSLLHPAALSPSTPLTSPAIAPTGPIAARTPDLSEFAAILPRPGDASRVSIEGLSILLRTIAGEVLIPFGRIETALAQTQNGALDLDFSLPLLGGGKPPSLGAHAELERRTGKINFSVTLPAFAASDLPVLPGAPPWPLRGNVAFDASGHIDLAGEKLDDVAFGLLVSEGELALPESNGTKIPVEKIEIRGRYDFATQHAVLETGKIRAGSLAMNVTELDLILGAKTQARWQLELTGPSGADVFAWLPARIQKTLPLNRAAMGTIAVKRFSTRGSATFARDVTGAWISRTVDSDGQVELSLGAEPFVGSWSVRQPEKAALITLDASLAEFIPARWPNALIASTPAGALDVPIALQAQATLTSAGAPRSARVVVIAAPGTLKPLQPGLPALAVKHVEVRAESEEFDRAWRVPVARLELASGATAELSGAQFTLSPKEITIRGEAQAGGFSGEFATLFLPADAWIPLNTAGLSPREISLDLFRIKFDAKAVQAGAMWQPSFLAVNADARLKLHAVPLGFAVKISLSEQARQIETSVDLAEFRPSQLGLNFPGGFATSAFDFPVSLHASLQTTLRGELTRADTQLHVGPGRLKTPPAWGDVNLPVNGLTLDAGFDPSLQRVDLKMLRIEAGGLGATLRAVTASFASPHAVTGHLELDAFSLATTLKLWPASQQPEIRQQVVSTLRAGEFLGAAFDGALVYDPAAHPALQVSRLQGTARLEKIAAWPDGIPGPVTLGDLLATVDFPRATVALQTVMLPGATLPTVQLDVSALNTTTPAATLGIKFEADLTEANRLWKFSAAPLFGGKIQGELTASAPLSVDSLEAQLALDLGHAKFPLPGFANAAPSSLNVSVRVAHPLSKDASPAIDFSLSSGEWLGAPLQLEGHLALSAQDHSPTLLELTNYAHGRTRLHARFIQPEADHREISVSGPYLDLAPLMRFGLAAADRFAAVPATIAPPVAPVPASLPALPASAEDRSPTTKIDVRIDEIEFGVHQIAREFQLQTQLEHNWPTSLTFRALTGLDSANLLSGELTGPEHQPTFALTIGAAADWMLTLTAPWHEQPPAAGQFGTIATQLIKVPSIVSGGGISAGAELRRGEPEWLQGRLKLTHATLVRPPRVLQALALKTGKTLQKSPLIDEFSVGRVTLSLAELRAANIALSGSGLINNVKIKSASYGLTNDQLYIDGEYFGVGFEIKGTLAKPEVWLKDSNLLIRSIGTRNDNFGFDAEPEPAPAPKSKKP